MKTAKSVTAGLALLLAILILLFLATQYVSFHPTDTALEESSKAELFFTQNDMYRDYLRLAFLLCISYACGMLFDRLPELGVLSALLPLCYAVQLIPFKRLTKHPMVVVSLCLAHLCGAVVYCGYRDRAGVKRHSSNACLLCSATAFGCALYPLFYQGMLKSVSEELAALKEASVSVYTRVNFQPDLIRMVYMKLKNFGPEEAREMMADFNRELNVSTLKLKILETVKEEQFASYLRLCILLFGTAVLIFALRRKLRLVPALLSAMPVIYAALMIHTEKMDGLALPILTASLFSLICGVTAYDQFGKGHDPVYTDEPEPEVPEDPDETYYT